MQLLPTFFHRVIAFVWIDGLERYLHIWENLAQIADVRQKGKTCNMETHDIDIYLQALSDELARRGLHVQMMLVGGAYMLLTLGNRSYTEDIDVMLLNMPDTTHKTPETKAFMAAVKVVAKNFRMKQKWMNDVVADFIRDMAPNPPLSLWKQYSNIDVYMPTPEYILVLKLMTFRKKDMDDIDALLHTLGITTREQAFALVDSFVVDKGYYGVYDLEDNLDNLFE